MRSQHLRASGAAGRFPPPAAAGADAGAAHGKPSGARTAPGLCRVVTPGDSVVGDVGRLEATMSQRCGCEAGMGPCGGPWWRYLFLLIMGSAGLPGFARASHLVVAPDGSGDYTTIQAAVNANAAAARDTILVEPGTYAEALAIPTYNRSWNIVGVGGAAATTLTQPLQGSGCCPGSGAVTMSGFTWTVAVQAGRTVWLDACVLEAGGVLGDECAVSKYTNCTLLGPTTLYVYQQGVFSGLHFVHAPASLRTGACGGGGIGNCTFEGQPGDVLLSMGGDDWDPASVGNSTFSGGRCGIEVGGVWAFVYGCTFTNLDTAIVAYGLGVPMTFSALGISGCRIEGCGTGVQARRWIQVQGAADTVSDCAGDGVVLGGTRTLPMSSYAPNPMSRWVVTGNGGDGIRALLPDAIGIDLEDAYVAGNGGDGIRIGLVDTVGMQVPSQLLRCRCEHNRGAGFHVAAWRTALRNCVAWQNGSNGIEYVLLRDSGFPDIDSLAGNTSAGNTGDGILVSGAATTMRVITGNLTGFDTGAGFEVQPGPGSLLGNDAWRDTGGATSGYPAFGDSNLTFDPGFCSLVTGDLTLAAGSPCAPTGPYGLIGAYGVGCAVSAGVEPAARPAAFCASPSPSRGQVEFSLPAATAAGRLDVIDLLGRVRWSQDVPMGASRLHWDGRTTAGPLPPGLYWARLLTPAGVAVTRVVWMR